MWPPESLPPCGGGGWPLGQTDEGIDFRLGLLYAGEFRRLRAATYFAHGGKVGKTPPGTAPDEHFVLIVAFPRTPLRETRS